MDKSSSLMVGARPAQWDGNQTLQEHYARRSLARTISIWWVANAFKMTAPRASSHLIKKENARCQDARKWETILGFHQQTPIRTLMTCSMATTSTEELHSASMISDSQLSTQSMTGPEWRQQMGVLPHWTKLRSRSSQSVPRTPMTKLLRMNTNCNSPTLMISSWMLAWVSQVHLLPSSRPLSEEVVISKIKAKSWIMVIGQFLLPLLSAWSTERKYQRQLHLACLSKSLPN